VSRIEETILYIGDYNTARHGLVVVARHGLVVVARHGLVVVARHGLVVDLSSG